MRILAIDAALTRCQVALMELPSCAEAVVLGAAEGDGGRGQSAQLAAMAQNLLAAADGNPEWIAVSVGPGSFTGIRAALALAHGIGLALGIPVVGVTIGEALTEALADTIAQSGRTLWCATASRRGRVFIERSGDASSFAVAALPRPAGPILVAGDAAILVAASLAASGADVMLTPTRLATCRHIAMAAAKRHAGLLPPRASQPMYVDPPEATLPRGGLRPGPAEAG